MRPLPQSLHERIALAPSALALRRLLLLFVLLAVGADILGCGGGGAGSGPPPPPPPPSISVTVSPISGTVLLGGTAPFSASVTNTTDTAVSWSVNNIPGGSAQVGTISADGLYTAPADLPQGGTVHVTATSHADSTKSGTASVTVHSDISVAISPGASRVELGSAQPFQASITSAGHPDPAIHWSLSGAACPNSCGVIDANGNYIAPQILPASALVTITATSAADPSKQMSAAVTVTSNFTLQLAAPGSLPLGVTAALVATFTPVPGSNPSPALSWSLSGSGCSGNGCGILTVITTQSTGGAPIADTANYTAPVAAPQPITVTITVTPQADPTRKAQGNIVILSGAALGLSPLTATLAANRRTTLTVTETGVTGTLNWTVNGIPGGNSTLGQICALGSSPCQTITSGSALQVDYLAPGAIPTPNPVSVQVSSATNPLIFASSQITVINHILVSVLPSSLLIAPLGVQGFTASVLGSNNQSVIWQVQGSGCPGNLCGAITPLGAYTAPAVPPSPNAFQVVAISQDDASQSGLANVSISTGANILTLHPASVYAGGANGFTLVVTGSGFVPSSPGPGSTLLLGGTPRISTCDTANTCSAPVGSADVAQPASLSVQIQNPNATKSNAVSLLVVAPGTGETIVTLSNSAPSATGVDITVVEPTTAGLDSSQFNLDLQVAAIGTFVTSTNTCNLAGNPIPLARPGTGTSAADICLFSQSGFDTSMNYTVSGPGDVAVIAKQPAGLGIIHLTLQIPAAAAPGARTLFIQNANLDRTAASGVLEIQ